jgi:acetyl-CoA acetyltransferase
MTPFGKTADGVGALAAAAVAATLTDAGLTPADVGHVYFGNAAAGLLQGQEMIRGQVFLRDTGLLGKTIVNVENACASSTTAFMLAVNAVAGGITDVALAVGAECLVVPAKTRTFAALASATDTERRADMKQIVNVYALGEGDPGDLPPAASPIMAHYAGKARAYLERTGASVEDLARVVVKSREYGRLNPVAQFRSGTTVEQVLAGRVIADPLRLAMCAPVGNGAAAVVVVSERVAARLGRQDVRVRAVSLVSNDPGSGVTPARRAALLAYESAGVDPADVDLAEVHDAAAPAELALMEDLLLCGEGDAFKWVRDGRTGLGGDRPVNTSGGLLSRGHPIGATGCGQLVEIVDQLRGRAGDRQVAGARLGLAQNGGGVLGDDEATVAVSVLERTR